MATTTSDTLDFDWQIAPPAESRVSKIGDHFPQGIRLRFEVTSLVQEINDKGGKRVLLEARCISAPCEGLRLTDSFGFPMAHEMGDENKLYGAKLFHAFMVACGAKQMTGKLQVPLSGFKGRNFECFCKDKTLKESDERDEKDTNYLEEGRPQRPKWPEKISSQIQTLFRPEGTTPVGDASATAAAVSPPAPPAAPAAVAPAPATPAPAAPPVVQETATPPPAQVAAAPAAPAPAAAEGVAAAVDALFE